MHTRKGANQKDLVRGKTKLILKMQVSGTKHVPNEQKTFDFFFEACEAEKRGLTGRRSSSKVVLVP